MHTLTRNKSGRRIALWVEWIAFCLVVSGMAVAVAVVLGSAVLLLASTAQAAEPSDAHSVRYRVSRIEVVDKGALQLPNQGGSARLSVTTCLPFDAARAGGSLRYVVIAKREVAPQPGTSNL